MDPMEKYYRECARAELEQGEPIYVEFYNSRLDIVRERARKVTEEAQMGNLPSKWRPAHTKRRFHRKQPVSVWVLCDYNERTIVLLEDGRLAWCHKYTGRATPIELKPIERRVDIQDRQLTQENLGRLCSVFLGVTELRFPDDPEITEDMHRYLGSVPTSRDDHGHH